MIRTSRLTSSMAALHKISRVCLFLLHFTFLQSKLVLHSFKSLFSRIRLHLFFQVGVVPLAGRILIDFENITG